MKRLNHFVFWIMVSSSILLARKRDFGAHKRMMLRSFALTFAAVTFRIQIPYLFSEGSTYLEISHIVAWTSWVPNLLVIELWLWATRPPNAQNAVPAG